MVPRAPSLAGPLLHIGRLDFRPREPVTGPVWQGYLTGLTGVLGMRLLDGPRPYYAPEYGTCANITWGESGAHAYGWDDHEGRPYAAVVIITCGARGLSLPAAVRFTAAHLAVPAAGIAAVSLSGEVQPWDAAR